MKRFMPKYKYENGFKPTQELNDRCVRGGWLYECKGVRKILPFLYITTLVRGVFEEGEF
mgnify:FL=1